MFSEIKSLIVFVSALAVMVCAAWSLSDNQAIAAPACSGPSFAIVVTSNVSNSLNSLAAGDLNGDAKPDIVATNYFLDKFSILFGDGAGNFTLSTTLSTGARPSAVALGDFNQDGKLDIAVTRDFSTTVSVLLNNGTGSFSAPTDFTVGNNPLALVLADFNNDGKLDIATGNDGSNTISILLGNGAGSFAPATALTNIRPATLVAADFNHDGKIDIAAANVGINKVTVLLGDGNGGFGAANSFDAGSQLRAIAAADFNGDGHQDIAITNYSDSSTPAFVAVLLGDGAGSFGAATKFSVPFGPFAIAVGDFNGDTNIDVATANVQQTSSNVAVLLGNGSGGLGTATTFNVGTTPTAIVANDINADGALDLAVTSAPNIAALLNACGGAPTPTPTPTPTPSPTPTPTPTPAQGSVVISQVYSNGGNSGSTYQNNYLELFNRTNNPIDFDGWRIYFTSANGTFDQAIAFVSSRQIFIGAHQYLLIRFGPDSSNGAPVPADLLVPFNPPPPGLPTANLSPSGKVFLTMPNVNLFGNTCPPNAAIIDFVGYGSTASCFEGSGPTATISNTTAALRKVGGCTDTDNNANDFSVSGPNPRNSSAPAAICSNPIDDADFFVRQHYSDFLLRDPDASGLAFWKDQITSCGADQACIEIRRINVSAAFFLSIEFQETGYLVYRTYKAAYGNLPNKPVPILFNELVTDTHQIGLGVIVNSPGWEQQLESNKLAYFMDFVMRSRFTNAYPTSFTPTQFVDTLFTNAGVSPTAAEHTSLINEFGSATNTADTSARARVVRRVAENPTLYQLEYNPAFVLMQYFGYLRRNPNEPPEPGLNFDGYNFWLTKLNQFNGNFVNADMVKAFIISTEYRQRFGP
jgi:hypothetical protein